MSTQTANVEKLFSLTVGGYHNMTFAKFEDHVDKEYQAYASKVEGKLKTFEEWVNGQVAALA